MRLVVFALFSGKDKKKDKGDKKKKKGKKDKGEDEEEKEEDEDEDQVCIKHFWEHNDTFGRNGILSPFLIGRKYSANLVCS